MKKLILLILAVVCVIGAGVYFIMPSNNDWEAYIKEACATVKKETGLELRIEGKPTYLKASTTLKFGKITLSNVQGGTFDKMIVAQGGEVHFDPKVILKRQYLIEKILLKNAEVFVERLPSGKWNWQTAFLDRETDGAKVGFDSLLLNDGVIHMRQNRYADEVIWKDFNGELAADGLYGPFNFEGSFKVKDATFIFSFKTNSFSKFQSPDITFTVANSDAEARILFSGKYGMTDKDKGNVNGTLTFEFQKSKGLFNLLFDGELPEELFLPIKGSATIDDNLETRVNTITDLVFKYGSDTAASGKMKITTLTQEEAVLLRRKDEQKKAEQQNDGNKIYIRDPANPSVQVDIDEDTGILVKVSENFLPKNYEGVIVFSKFAMEPVVKNIVQIFNVFGQQKGLRDSANRVDFDVMFDQATYGEDKIKQMRLTAKSGKLNEVDVTYKAQLPGDTRVEGTGKIKLADVPSFDTDLKVKGDTFGSTLKWGGVHLSDELPPNAYRNIDVNAKLTISQKILNLSNLSIELDKIKAKSNAYVLFGENANASVEVNGIDFTMYAPETNQKFNEAWVDIKKKDLYDKLKILSDYLQPYTTKDINMQFYAEQVIWSDLKAKNIEISFALDHGKTIIETFKAQDVWGVDLDLSGEISRFGASPEFSDLNISATAKNLSVAVNQLGLSAIPADLMKNDLMVMTGEFSGNIDLFDFDTKFSNDVLKINAKGKAKRVGTEFLSTLDVDASHENLRRFVALFTDKYRPVSANPGNLSLHGTMMIEANQIKMPNFVAEIAKQPFTGSLLIDKTGQLPVLNLDLSTNGQLPLLSVAPRLNMFNVTGNEATDLNKKFFETEGLFAGLDDIVFPRTIIDTSFLRGYESKVNIHADRVLLGGGFLKNAEFTILTNPNGFKIDIQKAVLDESPLVGSITMGYGNGMHRLKTDLSLSSVSINSPFFNNDRMDLFFMSQGSIKVNTEGFGSSLHDIVQTMAGNTEITFDSIVLKGVQYNDLSKKSRNLKPENKEEFIKTSSLGRTNLSKVSAKFNVQKGQWKSTELQGIYNKDKISLGLIEFNLPTGTFSSSLNFVFDDTKFPVYILSLEKTSKQNLVVKDNMEDFLKVVFAENSERIAKEEQRKEDLRKAEEEKLAKELNDRREKIMAIDTLVSNAAQDVSVKLDELEDYKDAYRVQIYYKDLTSMAKDIADLQIMIQEILKQEKIDNGHVSSLERRKNSVVVNREQKINETFDTALGLGIKDKIYTKFILESNEVLQKLNTYKVKYSDNKIIEAEVDRVGKNLTELRKLNDGLKKITDVVALKIQLTDADFIYQKIKSSEEIVDKILSDMKQKQEAEKIRKEEEARLKAEEEARLKAEEEARLKAEAEQKAAEEEVRKSTIFKKNAVGENIVEEDETNLNGEEQSEMSGVLHEMSDDAESLTEQSNEDDSASELIIRRR